MFLIKLAYVLCIGSFAVVFQSVAIASESGEPPLTLHFPSYVLKSDDVSRYSVMAYNGDTSSALALAAHFSFMDPTGKMSEYWRYVGSWHGSSDAITDYLRSGVPLTPEQAVQKASMARWVWHRYSGSWNLSDRSKVKKAYLDFVEFKKLPYEPLGE